MLGRTSVCDVARCIGVECEEVSPHCAPVVRWDIPNVIRGHQYQRDPSPPLPSQVKDGMLSDTSFSKGSLKAALRAAGAICHAVDEVGRVTVIL